MRLKTKTTLCGAAVMWIAWSAWADVDVSKVYSVDTLGTSASVQAGQKGVLTLSIHTEKTAHVSNEAPLKIALSGKALTPEKTKLIYADAATQSPTLVRFQVPFAASTSPGHGELDAQMVFFVCTENLCVRQQKSLSVPVVVRPVGP